MKIKLTDLNNQPAGEIRLEGGKTVIEVKDMILKKDLEVFFSKPFEYLEAMVSKTSDIKATARRELKPNTKDFFVNAVGELKKFKLKGTLEGERFEI